MTAMEFINVHFGKDFEDEDGAHFVFEPQRFKKGDTITRYDQIESKIYFISKGIVMLTILSQEEELIIEFFFPNSFVCSYTSFILQKPSDVQVVALTDCELESMPYRELQTAYRNSFGANRLGRILTEQIYIVKSNREKDFLTKSAEERYQELMAGRPELIKLVPLNKIAKYLGIHPESLSRIRKEIIS